MRQLRHNNKALIGNLLAIVLFLYIAFATADIVFSPDDNIITDLQSIQPPEVPDAPNENSSWWSDIPIINGVFDFASNAFDTAVAGFNMIAQAAGVFGSIIAFDFAWLNSLFGDYFIIIKIALWAVMAIIIIKLLPTT